MQLSRNKNNKLLLKFVCKVVGRGLRREREREREILYCRPSVSSLADIPSGPPKPLPAMLQQLWLPRGFPLFALACRRRCTISPARKIMIQKTQKQQTPQTNTTKKNTTTNQQTNYVVIQAIRWKLKFSCKQREWCTTQRRSLALLQQKNRQEKKGHKTPSKWREKNRNHPRKTKTETIMLQRQVNANV